MKKITGKNVAKESWCDVRLTNILWVNQGRDLALTFSMHQDEIVKLTCTWLHTINITLVSGNNEGGYPMTFDTKIQETDNNGWDVLFNFAHRGFVGFKCNELSLEF